MNNNEYKLDEEANYTTYAYSNTPSLSYEKNVPLYQLVSKKNEKLYGNRLASNNDLFFKSIIFYLLKAVYMVKFFNHFC